MIEVLAAARICKVCGDLAYGDSCPTCERLADRYDARYYAFRAATLFAQQPRTMVRDDGLAWDGLGAMRGAANAIRWTVAASVISLWVFGMVQWIWPR